MPQASSSLAPRLTQLAGKWFARSGIQEPNGGVARYHHSDTHQNARVSTEITGYAVSALVAFDQRDAAARAARFLTRTAWDQSLKTFPFEHGPANEARPALAYFFDCGIIVRGLLSLWHVVGDQELLDIAIQAGQSMARDFAISGAEGWHPILELPGKQALPWTDQWSRRPGCYQLKSALAWHDLFEATGDSRFAAYFAEAVAVALANKDDFLPAETREKTMDRLHAYCYFLEGLLPLAHRPGVRSALAEGILRVSGYLRDIRSEFERSDVYAQLLRIRLAAGVPLNLAEASEEASAVEMFQIQQPGSLHHGGFWFGRKAGVLLPFINPVSTAFCAQALDWWQEYRSGRPLPQAII